MGNEVYEGTGETALEAIKAFSIPDTLLTKGMLTIAKNGKKKEIFVVPNQIKRLKMKLTQPFLVKQFEFGLK